MNPLAFLKTRLFATLVAGVLVGDLFFVTGCVYPVVPPGPAEGIGVYSPAGYYRNYPVYIYRGRPLITMGKALLYHPSSLL